MAEITLDRVRKVFADGTEAVQSFDLEIEEDLIIESPGSAGSYEEKLRRDAELVAEGLDSR